MGTVAATLALAPAAHALTFAVTGTAGVTFVATDAVGNASDPATVTTTVDTPEPATTITSGPAGGWNKPSATFTFVADEDATFECRLDALPQTGTYGPCTSPATYGDLVNGTTYEFRVRAKDALGHTDSSPELRQFRVDTALPDTPVIDTPSDNPHVQNSSTVVLAGTGSVGSSVVVNTSQTVPVGTDGRWTFTLVDQGEGRHDYEVRATNPAGQTGTDGRTVFVDLTPPQTTIVSGPLPGGTNGVTFEFSSSEAGKQFTCTFTGPGEFPPAGKCSSPQIYSFLQEGGSYTFTVAAIDDAGNTDPAPASVTFSYDHVPPVAQIDSTWPSPTNNNTPTIAFSAEPGSTFVCHVDAEQDAPCVSPLTLAQLADGDHSFSVKATDPAGNVQKDATTFKFVVDTVAPTVTITSIPGPLTNLFTFDIAFTASEPGVTFECMHFWPGTPDPDVAQCTSAWSFRELPDGVHRFALTATDAAGNPGPTVSREVTIDSAVPTPVEPAFEGTTFTFAAAEPGTTFECRVEGLAGDSGFEPCESPKAYAGLPGGDYHFTLRTLDDAGNYADANPRPFSVAQTPQINPTPTATATPTSRPTATPTPTPEIGDTVVVQPVSGKILVRAPGSSVFVALDATKGLRVGTEIDARNGKIRLTSEPGQGKPVQKADFYGGIFTVTQGSDGFVELRLTEALAACPKKKRKKASAAATKPKKRKLWGDGKGKFRTRGQYSAATIRGTRWLVEDSCEGTLTRVANGVVSVRANGSKKTILLRAGKSYLAKPKR